MIRSNVWGQFARRRVHTMLAILVIHVCALTASAADVKVDGPTNFTYQMTGLFQPDREHDLREAFTAIPEIRLVSIDMKNAEAVLEFDPKTLFPGTKPTEILKRVDEKIRTATQGTFGVKPRRTTLVDKLQWIEIAVEGLDCKACSFAAYEAVYKLDGVEQATASFKEGRVRAWINPEITSREKLVEALTKKRVTVKSP